VSTKFSAYLSIYNDWDFLEPMLRSIAPYVDDLVVVDGAYAWMAEHMANVGCDPLRSDPRVYEALDASGIPYRVVTKLWANEIEKRIAGYATCRRRYILRIDADEVIFFDEPELERFLAKGGAVAQVTLPSYIAPGWLKAIKSPEGITRLPCAPILFDSHRIRPDIHLNYLWLVLGSETHPNAGVKPVAVHLPPVAFNAHLQSWRKLLTATQRAEFYLLQNVREKGIWWLKELKGKPIDDLAVLFDLVPAQKFRDVMQASRTGSQRFYSEDLIVVPSPLKPEQEAVFCDCYTAMLDDLVAFNRTLLDAGLHFATSWPVYLDISSPDCFESVVHDNFVHFGFSCGVRGAQANLDSINSSQPWVTTLPLEVRIDGRFAAIRIPEPEGSQNWLRRQIHLQFNTDQPGTIQKFHIRKGGSPSPAA
jgi:hypothetical protein